MKKITNITTNNNQTSNNNKNNKKKIPTIYPKIFVKTYQSYKNTDAQNIGNKTARHFLQY